MWPVSEFEAGHTHVASLNGVRENRHFEVEIFRPDIASARWAGGSPTSGRSNKREMFSCA